MASIFYDGDLESGISLALKDSKFLGCFVRDDSEESSKWESEYLGDTQVRSALADRAITLRITAGSQEAAHLTAYYPVPIIPAFLLIHNGVLVSDLKLGNDKAAFKAGILTILVSRSEGLSSTRLETATASTLPEGSSAASRENSDPGNRLSVPFQPPLDPSLATREHTTDLSQRARTNATRSTSVPGEAVQDPGSPSADEQTVVQRLLAERRRKLEREKEKKESEEKADRSARKNAQNNAAEAAPDSAKAKQATYAQEQRKRNAEVKLERERVLRQIEQDKADRREREERRKALVKAQAQNKAGEESDVAQIQTERSNIPRRTDKGEINPQRDEECAVQVRLFDGSVLRNKFTTEQTLADVRAWIDRKTSEDFPFTFKQVLSPLPNRSIMISEEVESLFQLGFVPSVTLLMIPIKGYKSAYADAAPSAMSRISALLYKTVAAGVGMVMGALGTVLGFGQAVPPQEGTSTHNPSPAQTDLKDDSVDTTSHVRTIRDEGEHHEDTEFYNGNQINVQPRNDETDNEE